MLIALYPTKANLKSHVGQSLAYRETSMFGEEYTDNGTFAVCNRPSLAIGYRQKFNEVVREFFAEVTMVDGKIAKVK